jgi:hypothetical protein
VASGNGHPVVVPDLTGIAVAAPPSWEALVETAVAGGASLRSQVAVIGHSGAGAFLPEIGRRLREATRILIFIDAVLPPHQGAHRTSPHLASLLDDQTADGMLRPWLEWWPEGTVEQILPDPGDRSVLGGDLPVLPRSFYDEDVPVPDGWSERACGYLRLSPAYDVEYEEAGRRDWQRRSIEADHLSIYTQPDRVFQEIRGLLQG